MIGRLRHITPEELERLRQRPNSTLKFLKGKATTPKRMAQMAALFGKLQKAKEEALARGAATSPKERDTFYAQVQRELAAVGLANGPGLKGLSLEKSWHVLHYLLTGEVAEATPPLGLAILGGTEIGEDLGQGPARFLTPDQVAEVSTALARLTLDDLAKRFESAVQRGNDLYACRGPGDVALAAEAFDSLRSYYADAARLGNAVILWID